MPLFFFLSGKRYLEKSKQYMKIVQVKQKHIRKRLNMHKKRFFKKI